MEGKFNYLVQCWWAWSGWCQSHRDGWSATADWRRRGPSSRRPPRRTRRRCRTTSWRSPRWRRSIWTPSSPARRRSRLRRRWPSWTSSDPWRSEWELWTCVSSGSVSQCATTAWLSPPPVCQEIRTPTSSSGWLLFIILSVEWEDQGYYYRQCSGRDPRISVLYLRDGLLGPETHPVVLPGWFHATIRE